MLRSTLGLAALLALVACKRTPTSSNVAQADPTPPSAEDATLETSAATDAAEEVDRRPKLRLEAMDGPYASPSDACAATVKSVVSSYSPSSIPHLKCLPRPTIAFKPTTTTHPFLEAATLDLSGADEMSALLALVRFPDGWYASTQGATQGEHAMGMMKYQRYWPRLLEVTVEGTVTPVLRFEFETRLDRSAADPATAIVAPYRPDSIEEVVIVCARASKPASAVVEAERVDLKAPPPHPRLKPLEIDSAGELDLVALPADAGTGYWSDQHVVVVWP